MRSFILKNFEFGICIEGSLDPIKEINDAFILEPQTIRNAIENIRFYDETKDGLVFKEIQGQYDEQNIECGFITLVPNNKPFIKIGITPTEKIKNSFILGGKNTSYFLFLQ